ncbi:MAG: hypothetical protein ACK55I_40225, partial [bacterium]
TQGRSVIEPHRLGGAQPSCIAEAGIAPWIGFEQTDWMAGIEHCVGGEEIWPVGPRVDVERREVVAIGNPIRRHEAGGRTTEDIDQIQ